jgi:cell division protein FtsL
MDPSVGAALRKELDAIELLMQDQREVESLFREFEYLRSTREDTNRVVELACAELKMHDVLNTEVFCPAVLEATHEPEMEKLLAAVADGLQATRDLVTSVEQAHGDQAQRDESFGLLARHVEREFERAETHLFPRTKSLKGLDLVSLAVQMKMRQRDISAWI